MCVWKKKNVKLTLRRTQIHTPTIIQGGEGWMEPLPGVYDACLLQYFETILPLVESLWSSYNKIRYVLWVVALLEACDNNDLHLAAILHFTKN